MDVDVIAGTPRTSCRVCVCAARMGSIGFRGGQYSFVMQSLPTTPGPCSVCPTCGAVAPPSGPPLFVYGLGKVAVQHCLSCNARWRFDWQEPAQKEVSKRRTWPKRVALAAVIGVVAAVVVLAVVVLGGGGASYPAQWDPQIATIAARVEALRGLTFKHPVKVNYLNASVFEKKLTAKPADLKKQRKQIEQATGLLRAAGLVGAGVDVAAAANTTHAADTAAFYDFHTKQIYLRTGSFTVETRVTLAHELTHVLQDQHFDLAKLQRRADASKTGSSDALTALIEGDANRIEGRYLAEQSLADRRAYDRLSTQSSGRAGARTKSVPAIVDTSFSAPYIFGPQVIRMLEAGGGNTAIDNALTGPVPSTRIYLDPTAVHVTATMPPPIPALRPGEKKLTVFSANDDSFDNFTFYLLLAARLDRPTALLAADAYATGSEVLYTRAGVPCFRAAIVGMTPDSTPYLASVLRRWTLTVPDAALESAAGPVVFRACDPGARAATPSDAAIREAAGLAVGRDPLTATFVGLRMENDVAACVARVLVQQPDVANALLRGDSLNNPTRQTLQESALAGNTCRTNRLAGLPGTTP
jgi:hypothetical protein